KTREGESTVCTLAISYQLSFIFIFFSRIKGKHQKPIPAWPRGRGRDYFVRTPGPPSETLIGASWPKVTGDHGKRLVFWPIKNGIKISMDLLGPWVLLILFADTGINTGSNPV